jgi:uncharacterized protein
MMPPIDDPFPALDAKSRRLDVPLIAFFVAVFGVSAAALYVLGLPVLNTSAQRNMTSLALFPVMVIGVALAGVASIAASQGRAGLGTLGRRMMRWKVGAKWYLALLIPPAAILLVLDSLRVEVSPDFAPNLLPIGLLFGIVAGFFEEIGWTGFAYPRLGVHFGPVGGSVLLGVLWGIWHLPVVDSLGTASPHGPAWPAFFAAFVALVAGLRVLISWIYARTGSVFLAQAMHASNTGFLVVFGAAAVKPGQEAGWYALDAIVLWLVAVVVIACGGFRSAPGRLAG